MIVLFAQCQDCYVSKHKADDRKQTVNLVSTYGGIIIHATVRPTLTLVIEPVT